MENNPKISNNGRNFLILLWSFILVFVLIIFSTNYFEYKNYSDVMIAKSDMGMLARAIEAYKLDNNEYPSWSLNEDSINGKIANPSFAITHKGMPSVSLTTPVSFISKFPNDPFGTNKSQCYAYYCSESGHYLIWSSGPNRKYEISYFDIQRILDSKNIQELHLYSYDPTNGTKSGGDIIYPNY